MINKKAINKKVIKQKKVKSTDGVIGNSVWHNDSFNIDRPLLKLTNVTKKFGTIVAVKDISFEVRKGERIGLIGANGSGKTTISEIIAGLTKPSSGDVEYGFNILVSRRKELSAEKTRFKHAKRAANNVKNTQLKQNDLDLKKAKKDKNAHKKISIAQDERAEIISEYSIDFKNIQNDHDEVVKKLKNEMLEAKKKYKLDLAKYKIDIKKLKNDLKIETSKSGLSEEEIEKSNKDFEEKATKLHFEIAISRATVNYRNGKVKLRMTELVKQRRKVYEKVIKYTRFFEVLNKKRLAKYRQSDKYKNAVLEYKRIDGLIRDLKFVKVPKEKIGMQFQDSIYPSGLTLRNIINFAIRLHKLPISEDEVYQMLKIFQMEDFYKRDSRSLSGGQRQKLNIFLALLHKPELIILDELSTGLDLSAREEIIRFVNNILKEKNVASILISHHMDEIEALCDRVIVFDNGTLYKDTSIAEIKKEYGSMADFMRWIINNGHKNKKIDEPVSIIDKLKEVIQ